MRTPRITIEHIAIWTQDLEQLRAFYETYFQAHAGKKYVNSIKQFESYFLDFQSGARLEIMQTPGLEKPDGLGNLVPTGYAHLAFGVGSEAEVDALTDLLRTAGYPVVDGPRWTGDGYYESVILDPDGNRVEITVYIK